MTLRHQHPGEGCYIANINGPVRAIRSYMGANSGVFTQRDHIFYESRQDIVTYARVHKIGAILDFYDYSPEATGMVYQNNNNKFDVDLLGIKLDLSLVIDGKPDKIWIPGSLKWEMLDGTQGGLIIAHRYEADFDTIINTSYYLDEANADNQFTGDPHAYGSSGIYLIGLIYDMEQTLPDAKNLTIRRHLYYTEPGLKVENAKSFFERTNNPLRFEVQLLK